MKMDDMNKFIRSAAVTIFVGTMCVLLVMKQVPTMMAAIKELKKKS